MAARPPIIDKIKSNRRPSKGVRTVRIVNELEWFKSVTEMDGGNNEDKLDNQSRRDTVFMTDEEYERTIKEAQEIVKWVHAELESDPKFHEQLQWLRSERARRKTEGQER